MNRKPKIERSGVHSVGKFFSDSGWLFREQPSNDVGIDAQVEIVEEDAPTGKLIAMQIKSGMSYCRGGSERSFVIQCKNRHINYWVNHSLPVIVVLYNPENKNLYWENVSEKTIKKTKGSWKIEIPKTKVLDSNSLVDLCSLTQPPPDIRRLNKLRLDRIWIDLLAQGEVLYVEFDDWINKSLPRFVIRIGCATRNDVKEREWPTTYAPGLSFEELLKHLIPWADFNLDEEAYRDFMEESWMENSFMWYDNETGVTHYTMAFEEYYEPPDDIVPIGSNGETESYRLILSLNALGRSFLTLDNYLKEEDDLGGRSFILDL